MTEETTYEENTDVQDRDESVDNQHSPSYDEPDTNEVDKQSNEEDVKAAKKAGVSVEEFERTRKALAKANEEAKDRRLKLKEFEELGVDPEKIKSMLQKQRESEIAQMEEEKRYSELLEKMREEANMKVSKAEEKMDLYRRNLERETRGRQIQEAIASEDGVSALLEGIVEKRVKTTENEDGSLKTYVTDEYGQETDMSVRDFVKSLKDHEEYGYGFKAPKVSGNGTNSDGASKPPSSKPGPKKRRGDMSFKEKEDYIKQEGIGEYNKLPL